MFIRVTKQTNKKGEAVEYLALAESVRVPGKKHPGTIIIKNIGRVDHKKLKALRRLQNSIAEFLDKHNFNDD